ncbi:MAG: efflux RND transporter permease subunit [Candidatus Omnitrophica bacterium]|nr:efflux RND transporter permease subunit [Candidatus Omnitrophota bacterium]
MKLAHFSVKNSVLINLISFLIIIMGIFAMFKLRKEAFPQVDYDLVTITTIYPGAPTEDVEKFVTIPIEKEIKGISGIKEITSGSEEGQSVIGITIDPKASDKRQVVDDIERAVDRISNLPEGVKDDPVIFELRSKEIPVLEISLSGGESESQRREYAESLEDIILNINGVANVNRLGWRDPEFHIEVDPDKLREYYVSINEVMDALRSRNITLPGGHLTTSQEEFNIRTTGEFNKAHEIEDVIIRANDAGNWLRVGDVANVKSTYEDMERIARTKGKRSLGMVVVKNETSDIIKVVDKVNAVIDQFKNTLPAGMDIEIANDISFYVKRRLGVLKTNGAIGFLLVVIILFLFLDPIPAITTAMGIPIALFTCFFAMNALGVSINLVSMLGLILVLGMLVDDGIIVSENVYRYIEQGMHPREAAVKGTSEVIAPVTATILTTVAAFGPLLFIPDIIGKFIREIPIVVILALGASLIEAFFILPSHLADFIRPGKYVLSPDKKKKPKKGWFNSLTNFYLKILKGVLSHRYLVVIGLIAGFVFTIWFALYVYKIKVIMFTGEGIEDFYIRAEAPKGTSLEQMEELIKPVEELITTLPETELDSYRSFIGSITNERGFDPNAKNGSHLAQLTVFLTPMQQRTRTPKEIQDTLREKFDSIEGFDKLYFHSHKEGPPTGKAVEVAIKGDKFEVMNIIANQIVDYLDTIPGVSDVSSNYEYGKKELSIKVNEEKAKKYLLTIEDIATTVRYAFKGGVATSVKPLKAEEEIQVIVRFPEEYRNDISDFEKILVRNREGNLVPLGSVATIVEREGLYAITHLNGKRAVYVTADVDSDTATSSIVNQRLKKEFKNITNNFFGYSLKFGGEYEEQQETQANLLFSFIVALFLIFIILTAIFHSMVQPLIVMTAIPFGFLGILIAFMLHGQPISFFALMGAVGLTGIVVNDSVVLVDFINRLRISGKGRRESLIEAGRTRLRPVLMTTITTIGGLVSVAYGIGGGDPFLKPMGLAIIWGLLFATCITLIVIPCFYAIIDDIIEKILRRGHYKFRKRDFDHPEVDLPALITRLTKETDVKLPRFKKIPRLILWLNDSILPYKLFLLKMSLEDLGDYGPKLMEKILVRFKRELVSLNDQELRKLAQTPEGMHLKWLVLRTYYDVILRDK